MHVKRAKSGSQECQFVNLSKGPALGEEVFMRRITTPTLTTGLDQLPEQRAKLTRGSACSRDDSVVSSFFLCLGIGKRLAWQQPSSQRQNKIRFM